MSENNLENLTEQLEVLEENHYLEQQRLHLVPPHYILINPESQAEYNLLLKKDRRRQILEKGFLAFPEGIMVEDDDNLLAVVNEQVFQKPWIKLDLEFQINRLYVYLNQLDGLTAENLIKLRKLLVNACFRKELGSHQVIYDCQRGTIQQILGLVLQPPEVDLKILKAPEKLVPVVGVSVVLEKTLENATREKTPENATREKTPEIEKTSVATPEFGIDSHPILIPKITKPILKLKTQVVNPSDSLPKRKMPVMKPKINTN